MELYAALKVGWWLTLGGVLAATAILMGSDLGVGALAQQQTQGFHHNGFSGTGFAGQGVKAGAEFGHRLIHHGVIFDLHPQQHAQFRIRPTGRESHGQE